MKFKIGSESKTLILIAMDFPIHLKWGQGSMNLGKLNKYLLNSCKTNGKLWKSTEYKNVSCINRETMHLCQVNKIIEYLVENLIEYTD